MARVVFENVKKIYEGGVLALRDANLEVGDGEFLVLLGPSGCGKSTCLRLIAGLEQITEGNIYIGETLVNDIPPKARDIAMVFQDYALYPHMRVYDNLAFGLKLRKYPKAEIRSRVMEAARILEIEGLLERKPRALSGGQRQRVALGRAIVRKPKVFLLDEPLSNLDAKLRVQMRAELARLHERLATTMVYVTHDQVEAMTLGERVVVIRDGIFLQIDTPVAVYNYPVSKFVAGFIGSPPMNFLVGQLRGEGENIYFQTEAIKVKLAARYRQCVAGKLGKKVCLGVRPEDIHPRASRKELVDENCARASVEVVEVLGPESLVHFSGGGGESFVARFDTAQTPSVHQEVEILFNMDRTHIFDNDTGESLTAQAAREAVSAA